MSFFKMFPKIDYLNERTRELSQIIDISRNVDVNDTLSDDLIAYRYYNIQPGERPDIVSQKLYGTSEYYWTFFIINEHLKEGLHTWPVDHITQNREIDIEFKSKGAFTVIPSIASDFVDTNGTTISGQENITNTFANIDFTYNKLLAERNGKYAKIYDYNDNNLQLIVGEPYTDSPKGRVNIPSAKTSFFGGSAGTHEIKLAFDDANSSADIGETTSISTARSTFIEQMALRTTESFTNYYSGIFSDDKVDYINIGGSGSSGTHVFKSGNSARSDIANEDTFLNKALIDSIGSDWKMEVHFAVDDATKTSQMHFVIGKDPWAGLTSETSPFVAAIWTGEKGFYFSFRTENGTSHYITRTATQPTVPTANLGQRYNVEWTYKNGVVECFINGVKYDVKVNGADPSGAPIISDYYRAAINIGAGGDQHRNNVVYPMNGKVYYARLSGAGRIICQYNITDPEYPTDAPKTKLKDDSRNGYDLTMIFGNPNTVSSTPADGGTITTLAGVWDNGFSTGYDNVPENLYNAKNDATEAAKAVWTYVNPGVIATKMYSSLEDAPAYYTLNGDSPNGEIISAWTANTNGTLNTFTSYSNEYYVEQENNQKIKVIRPEVIESFASEYKAMLNL